MKRRSSRNAVLMSALSLLLSVSMLLGTTFAWFTDSVTATNNIIIAGNLDIELYHTNKVDTNERVEEGTKLFDDVTLWEPGAVAYETFNVKNEGTLALKYRFDLNALDVNDFNTVTWVGDTNEYDLTDVIKVAIVEDPGFSGTREDAEKLSYESWQTVASDAVFSAALEPGAESDFTVVLYWEPGTNDNLYNLKNTGWTLNQPDPNGNNVLFINTGIALVATQAVHEHDSFDNTYDSAAQIPGAPVIKSDNISSTTSTDDISLTLNGVSPEGTGDSVVNFPAGSFTQADESLKVSVEAKNQLAANPGFEFDSNGSGVFATIEVSATVNGTPVTSFNGEYATIETYIEKGHNAADIVLVYVDENGVRTEAAASNGDFEIVSYDSATGKIVFKTNHFSTYELVTPFVNVIEPGVYEVFDVRGLFATAYGEDGDVFKLADNYSLDESDNELIESINKSGVLLEVQNDVTLDTGFFKNTLIDLPITVADGGKLTVEGEAIIGGTTLGSMMDSAGDVILEGGIYTVNPARYDDSFKAQDSEYIAINYTKGGQTYYVVDDRATTVVLEAGEGYVPENDNYAVTTNASGRLYGIISGLQNNDHNTVYLLPGTYNEGTTVYVYSSMDIIGLGDIADVKVVKTSSSNSNRHLFNCTGTKEDYIQVSVRNMTLDATAKTTGSKDNAAVQSIRKSKVKCYDLDIIKGTGGGAYAFYVNGNNAVDGVKYPAYMHAENCTLNAANAYYVLSTAGKYTFTHNNLTYSGKAYTNNSGSIKNVHMDYDNWDW